MLLGVGAVRLTQRDVFDDPDQAETLDKDWQDKQAQEFAKIIDTEPPKTDYVKEKTFEEKTNSIENHLLERIDMIDPSLSADLTREYMDVQKTEAAIARLEKKVQEESQGFDTIEQYNADKLNLDNMKAQLHEEAEQTVSTESEIKNAVEKSHSNIMKSSLQQSMEKDIQKGSDDFEAQLHQKIESAMQKQEVKPVTAPPVVQAKPQAS